MSKSGVVQDRPVFLPGSVMTVQGAMVLYQRGVDLDGMQGNNFYPEGGETL